MKLRSTSFGAGGVCSEYVGGGWCWPSYCASVPSREAARITLAGPFLVHLTPSVLIYTLLETFTFAEVHRG